MNTSIFLRNENWGLIPIPMVYWIIMIIYKHKKAFDNSELQHKMNLILEIKLRIKG